MKNMQRKNINPRSPINPKKILATNVEKDISVDLM
jgi:hypothetical protein